MPSSIRLPQALAPNATSVATQGTGSENTLNGKNQSPPTPVLHEEDAENLNALRDPNLQALRQPLPPTGTDGGGGGAGFFTMTPLEWLASGNPEPRVILEIEGKRVHVLLDTGANFSVLLSTSGQLSSRSVVVKSVTGQPRTKFFSPAGMHLGRSDFLLLRNNA